MTRYADFRTYISKIPSLACAVVLATLVAGTAISMPPHPDIIKIAAQKGTGDMSNLGIPPEAREAGVCAKDDFFLKFMERPGSAAAKLSPTWSSFKILALLVDFSDNVAAVTPSFYDSLVFDSAGRTIRDYFDEISYSQLDLVTVNLPSSLGWKRAPQTYAYYVNGEKGIGVDSYPQNSQGLVTDLVDLVDPLIDFSQYDNNSDGYVDILLVVHAGTGAEMSGSVDDIHSHKWSLPVPRLKDGVFIYSFTVQPEFWLSPGDMTIGVYAHELCHGFGLPDLYDTDYSSNGIGEWGLMAFGSWNGPGGRGGSPAHPCAWSRIEMGFASPVFVSANLTGQVVTAVENGGSIFRLPSSGAGGEYFLVENRQKTGYDTYLPGSGICIWHVDSTKSDNTTEWWPGKTPTSDHYLIALEQADGLFTLEQSNLYGNTGDAGDCFPGSTSNTSFSTSTTPNSDSYLAGSSITSVTNISPSGSVMSADLIVGTIAAIGHDSEESLPNTVRLAQNYPNPFNPVTVIEFSLEHGAETELTVHNLLGQKVRTLIDGYAGAGTTRLLWDATDDNQREVASGVYFYRLFSDEEVQTKKMTLIR